MQNKAFENREQHPISTCQKKIPIRNQNSIWLRSKPMHIVSEADSGHLWPLRNSKVRRWLGWLASQPFWLGLYYRRLQPAQAWHGGRTLRSLSCPLTTRARLVSRLKRHTGPTSAAPEGTTVCWTGRCAHNGLEAMKKWQILVCIVRKVR